MTQKQNPTQDEAEIETQLLDRFRETGFKNAFETLWLHHHQRLSWFIRGKGLDEVAAQDLQQEIGLKLFRYLSRHVVAMFPASAFKITKDEIADFYRALQRLPKLETLDDLVALNLEPAAPAPNQKMELWLELQKHMDEKGISREQQTAVILHHLIGYSQKEVAQITGSKPETVKTRLRYASLKMGKNRKQVGVA